ncbi:hypothetical protein Nmel_007185 [Mimus melanotis]
MLDQALGYGEFGSCSGRRIRPNVLLAD